MAYINWATHVFTMAITKRCLSVELKRIIKSCLSSDCSLVTREHEAGIASNRKIVHLR
jgi:hypothetical protein